MNDTRLDILYQLGEHPRTGPALAETCNITRAAVWKHIEALRNRGFEIASESDGYRLVSIPEFGGEAIALGLDAPYRVEFYDTTESTNAIARSLATAGEEDVIVVADRQVAGKGRLDRTWRGPSGGIYLSVLLRPSLPPMDVPLLTLGAAVAVAEALEDTGLTVGIKWPNDVLIQDRKVAGILTEMEGESDRVSWVVVGIGINANVNRNDLPSGATSLLDEHGEPVDRRIIVQQLVRAFHTYRTEPERIIPAWRQHSRTLGQRVKVTTAKETIVGLATDVAHPGQLVIESDTGTHHVHAGDCEHLRPDE